MGCWFQNGFSLVLMGRCVWDVWEQTEKGCRCHLFRAVKNHYRDYLKFSIRAVLVLATTGGVAPDDDET